MNVMKNTTFRRTLYFIIVLRSIRRLLKRSGRFSYLIRCPPSDRYWYETQSRTNVVSAYRRSNRVPIRYRKEKQPIKTHRDFLGERNTHTQFHNPVLFRSDEIQSRWHNHT